MPGFDKTGPQGQGAATGRGLGPCAATTDDPIDDSLLGVGRGGRPRGGGLGRCFGGGRGRGRGGRGGRGRGQGFGSQRGPQAAVGLPTTDTPTAEELEAMRRTAARLEDRLEAIKAQVKVLEGAATKDEA